MKTLKYLLLLTLMLPLSIRAQVKVEVAIDSMNIRIGEQAHVTLSVKVKEGQDVNMPIFADKAIITQGVEVLGAKNLDTLRLGNNEMKVRKEYTVTSFDENQYELPAFNVLVDGNEYKSNSLKLNVSTVPVDTTNVNKFYPPKDVQDNPFQWSEWSPLFWFSLILILLAVVMFYLIVRLRDNKPIIAKIRFVRKMLPHQTALKEINRIKKEKLNASSDQKEYYTALTDTFRKYLQERFGFNAMEMTSSEIIQRLREEADQEKIEELKQLLETADLVKFAEYSTRDDEKDKGLESVVAFINETKMENMPIVQKIEPTISEEDKRSRQSRRIILSVIAALSIVILAVFAIVCWNVYLLVF